MNKQIVAGLSLAVITLVGSLATTEAAATTSTDKGDMTVYSLASHQVYEVPAQNFTGKAYVETVAWGFPRW